MTAQPTQTDSNQLSELVDEHEAAQRLGGLPLSTLRYWRHRGAGPTYVRLGRRIYYRDIDLCAFVDAGVCAPRTVPHPEK